jgi:hypothetical protein
VPWGLAANMIEGVKDGAARRPPMRKSVSAEAYGIYNQLPQEPLKVYPKSDLQKDFLKNNLSKEFLFESLLPEDLDSVINAFQLQDWEAGSLVIEQGDEKAK